MKKTTTIYVCECGAEYDDSWDASIHYYLCRKKWSEKELTQEEYEAWKQARDTKTQRD